MTDTQELGVYAMYPGRRRDRLYEFVEEFAGPTVVSGRLAAGRVQLVDAAGRPRRSVPARTIREALELGLLNTDWAYELRIDSVGGWDTQITFTTDGHVVMGIHGSERDGLATSLERSMRHMMSAFPAEFCVLVAGRQRHFSADAWAGLVRAARADEAHPYPTYVRGEWFSRHPARAEPDAPESVLAAIRSAFATHGIGVSVRPTYPVRRAPGQPWTLLLEAPLRQVLGTMARGDAGASTAADGLRMLLAELERAHTGLPPADDEADFDEDPVRGMLLSRSTAASAADAAVPVGRLILHDISTDTQWVVPTDAPLAALEQIDPAVGAGRPLRWSASGGWA